MNGVAFRLKYVDVLVCESRYITMAQTKMSNKSDKTGTRIDLNVDTAIPSTHTPISTYDACVEFIYWPLAVVSTQNSDDFSDRAYKDHGNGAIL